MPTSISIDKIQNHLEESRKSLAVETKLRIKQRRLEEYMKNAKFSNKSKETIRVERRKIANRKEKQIQDALAMAKLEKARTSIKSKKIP